MEEKCKKGFIERVMNKIKIIKFLLFIIIILSVILYSYFVLKKQKAERRIIVRTQLDRIEEISELSTSLYTYNSVATKYSDKKNEDVDYHVICYAEVTTGIDFEKIKIDMKGKVLKLNLPELEIYSINIPMDKLQFIEEKKFKENENLLQDAHDLCQERIKEKIKYDADFKDNARENTKLIIEGFLKPWIESFDDSYKIEFK